jgi:hypothetical protein
MQSANLTIEALSGGWYKVSKGGHEGFYTQKIDGVDMREVFRRHIEMDINLSKTVELDSE